MKVPISEVLRRAGEYFMGDSPIHRAAIRLARTLADLEVPFAVAGALAANAHGHVRTTRDVDVLMTAEGLAKFKAAWLGRGWVEKFEGSRGIRDTIENVPIDVLIAGDFPGDGEPKDVVFPDPGDPDVTETTDGEALPVLRLPVLLELKLASGMTAAHRLQDIVDVMELIRANALPVDYAERLAPFVQAKFREVWATAQVDEDY